MKEITSWQRPARSKWPSDLKSAVKFTGGVNLRGPILDGGWFTRAILADCLFEECDLGSPLFTKARIERCSFHSVKFGKDVAVWKDVHCTDCKFTRCALAHISFEDCRFTNVEFSGSNLGDLRFMRCSFENVVANDVGAHAVSFVDPWGVRTKISGDLDTDVGFTGHTHHAASGLVLTWFRAYDPGTGRWMSRDPIGENGGVNLYGYVGNSPVSQIDPLGLKFCLQTHPIAFGHNHLSILFIPDNQAKYANTKGFIQNAAGIWYTTFGAGSSELFMPSLGNGMNGYVLQGRNRPNDANDALHPPGRRCEFKSNGSDDEYYNKLVAAYNKFAVNSAWSAWSAAAPYDFFPTAGSGGYNSNSYAAGLLGATGVNLPSLTAAFPGETGDWPGANVPIPASMFTK